MFEFTDPHKELLVEIGLPTTGGGFWNKFPNRFDEECNKMLNGTNAIPSSEYEKLIWIEDIENNFDSEFRIKIIVSPDFPFTAPKVFLLEPRISNREGKHMYADGSLCLFHPSEYSSKMSILDVRNLACAWCTLIENYANTGRWEAAEAH